MVDRLYFLVCICISVWGKLTVNTHKSEIIKASYDTAFIHKELHFFFSLVWFDARILSLLTPRR